MGGSMLMWGDWIDSVRVCGCVGLNGWRFTTHLASGHRRAADARDARPGDALLRHAARYVDELNCIYIQRR